MKFAEIFRQATAGNVLSRPGRIVRLLTQEEADALAFQQSPSRRTVVDPDTGKARVEDGQIIVEEYGEGDPKRFGLFDVSSGEPVPFQPNEDDFNADWGIYIEPPPEIVPPDVVDEVLAETEPPLEAEPAADTEIEASAETRPAIESESSDA